MRSTLTLCAVVALAMSAGPADAQRGPERLCVLVEGAAGVLTYKNTCKHCVSITLELTNSDGDPENVTFEVLAKSSHDFDSANYPRVRVPHVEVCPTGDDGS